MRVWFLASLESFAGRWELSVDFSFVERNCLFSFVDGLLFLSGAQGLIEATGVHLFSSIISFSFIFFLLLVTFTSIVY